MPNQIPSTPKLTAFWNTAVEKKSFGHPLPASVVSHFCKPGRVLDFGCGTGRLAGQLVREGFDVAGIDSSIGMLNKAQSNLSNCDFRLYEGSLSWDSNDFDAVMLVALLTSVPNRGDQARVIGETTRVLKVGGYIFVSDMPIQWSNRYVSRYKNGMKKYNDFGVFEIPNGGIVRHHQLSYFLQLMSPFYTLMLEPYEVTTMNGNQATAIRYLGQLQS